MIPRKDFGDKVENLKLTFHDEPTIEWSFCEIDSYWNEEGAAVISRKAEIEILEATHQLHSMCL